MAALLYRTMVSAECWITLLAEPTSSLTRVPDPPAPVPSVISGRGGLAINARCFDFGEVLLEVWAGDPEALPDQWTIVFDGEVEAGSNGLTAGTAYGPVYRIERPPGPCHVRAAVTRDENDYVDAVKLFVSD